MHTLVLLAINDILTPYLNIIRYLLEFVYFMGWGKCPTCQPAPLLVLRLYANIRVCKFIMYTCIVCIMYLLYGVGPKVMRTKYKINPNWTPLQKF